MSPEQYRIIQLTTHKKTYCADHSWQYFIGLLLEQVTVCPCLGALLALYVYVSVCILVIFFVSQINWIGLDIEASSTLGRQTF